MLGKDRTRKWFIEALDDARRKLKFDLWAWVVMPEHVHLLIYPREPVYKMASILAAVKRPVGEKAIAYLTGKRSSFLKVLEVVNKNRTYHRFWQVGPGHDLNVENVPTAHQIVEYIHLNPVRRHLVARAEGWYWSSARDWTGAPDTPMTIDRTLPPLLKLES